jgi:hypothetical protein
VTTPQADPSAGSPARCPRCTTPLQPGQDWCVNCGYAATTRVVPPGNWRWPIIVVTVIFLLGLGGVAGAFVAASGDAQHVTTTTLPAKTLPPTSTTPTAPAKPTTAPATTATTPTATTPTTSTTATPTAPTTSTKAGGSAATTPTTTTPPKTKTD